MKKHFKTLGLQEGATNEEIQAAYERLSNDLNPKNNDNEVFFKEEFEEVLEAYKALSSASILAKDKSIQQPKVTKNEALKKKKIVLKIIIQKNDLSGFQCCILYLLHYYFLFQFF